jgi:hypothetical protein
MMMSLTEDENLKQKFQKISANFTKITTLFSVLGCKRSNPDAKLLAPIYWCQNRGAKRLMRGTPVLF